MTDAAFTQVARSTRLEIDLRSPDPATLELIHHRLTVLAGEIAARRRVAIELGPETGAPPSALDGVLVAELRGAAATCGVATRDMVSGGDHDAVAFAAAGVPAALVFVRNQNGSHHAGEAMRREDFAAATRVAMRWLVQRGET